MIRRREFLLGGLAWTASLLAGCREQQAAVVPDFVLTYAENQPDGYPTTEGARRFAELVRERTGGKVLVQVKDSGVYGTEEEVWEQLAIGGVDFEVTISMNYDDPTSIGILPTCGGCWMEPSADRFCRRLPGGTWWA